MTPEEQDAADRRSMATGGWVLWANGARYWFPWVLDESDCGQEFGSVGLGELNRHVRALIDSDPAADWRFFSDSEATAAAEWRPEHGGGWRHDA